jgi:hypothetical protein
LSQNSTRLAPPAWAARHEVTEPAQISSKTEGKDIEGLSRSRRSLQLKSAVLIFQRALETYEHDLNNARIKFISTFVLSGAALEPGARIDSRTFNTRNDG